MSMRICLVYDCLFPHTVGGGERWYRALAERLAADGHAVTYLTLRQWDRGTDPDVPGVDVRVVGPRMALYVSDASGRRRILLTTSWRSLISRRSPGTGTRSACRMRASTGKC